MSRLQQAFFGPKSARRHHANWFRPYLEALEDRQCPAPLNFTLNAANANENWSDMGVWSGGNAQHWYPGQDPGDNATIANSLGGNTLSLNGSITINNLTFTSAVQSNSLNLNTHNLTVNGTFTYNVAS
jgi:hypothetical protein